MKSNLIKNLHSRWETWIAGILGRSMIRWEEKRKSKQKYILTFGLYYFIIGILGGLILFDIFNPEGAGWIKLAIFSVLSLMIGLYTGARRFKSKEAAYKYFCELGSQTENSAST